MRLKEASFDDKLSGTVEVDETYIGGKHAGIGRRYMGNKVPVVSLVERGGRVRSQVMRHVTGKNLKEVLKANVEQSRDDDHGRQLRLSRRGQRFSSMKP